MSLSLMRQILSSAMVLLDTFSTCILLSSADARGCARSCVCDTTHRDCSKRHTQRLKISNSVPSSSLIVLSFTGICSPRRQTKILREASRRKLPMNKTRAAVVGGKVFTRASKSYVSMSCTESCPCLSGAIFVCTCLCLYTQTHTHTHTHTYLKQRVLLHRAKGLASFCRSQD